jgi:hypothetical protein
LASSTRSQIACRAASTGSVGDGATPGSLQSGATGCSRSTQLPAAEPDGHQPRVTEATGGPTRDGGKTA